MHARTERFHAREDIIISSVSLASFVQVTYILRREIPPSKSVVAVPVANGGSLFYIQYYAGSLSL